MSPRKIAVSTWIAASRKVMFFVVWRTLKPAATSGVTWSKARLIFLEYGMPIVNVSTRFNSFIVSGDEK